jgi:hypothetical protein
LKQYSKTEKQHTTPPSSLGALARTEAATEVFTSSIVDGVVDVGGVAVPEWVAGVVVPEGEAERVMPVMPSWYGRAVTRELLTFSTLSEGFEERLG